MTKLSQDFYLLNAPDFAPKLLGKLLCIKDGESFIKKRITETEAYFGEHDTACHAHKGRTKRTEILYHQGGVAYVYLCYGIHSLLNVVCGDKDFPQAVLIRSVDGISGPGRLTKAMGITCVYNGTDLVKSGTIWLEDDGFTPEKIETSPRIGINYATQEYIDKPWRFYYK